MNFQAIPGFKKLNISLAHGEAGRKPDSNFPVYGLASLDQKSTSQTYSMRLTNFTVEKTEDSAVAWMMSFS